MNLGDMRVGAWFYVWARVVACAWALDFVRGHGWRDARGQVNLRVGVGAGMRAGTWFCVSAWMVTCAWALGFACGREWWHARGHLILCVDMDGGMRVGK